MRSVLNGTTHNFHLFCTITHKTYLIFHLIVRSAKDNILNMTLKPVSHTFSTTWCKRLRKSPLTENFLFQQAASRQSTRQKKKATPPCVQNSYSDLQVKNLTGKKIGRLSSADFLFYVQIVPTLEHKNCPEFTIVILTSVTVLFEKFECLLFINVGIV